MSPSTFLRHRRCRRSSRYDDEDVPVQIAGYNFHELLDSVRQLRKALITEIVVPSDDLDPFSRLTVLHDPGSDLLISGASRYILFKLFCGDTDKSKSILSSGQPK
jgi:hypothetical protein